MRVVHTKAEPSDTGESAQLSVDSEEMKNSPSPSPNFGHWTNLVQHRRVAGKAGLKDQSL